MFLYVFNFFSAIAYNNDFKMAKLLIENGADVNNPNNPVFYHAVKANNLEIVKLLIENGFLWDKSINKVYRARDRGGTAFEASDDPESNENKNDDNGDSGATSDINNPSWTMSVFHLCCYYGYIEILKYLFEIESNYSTKIDIFAKTSQISANGFTLACCQEENTEMISYLIKNVYIISRIIESDESETENQGNQENQKNQENQENQETQTKETKETKETEKPKETKKPKKAKTKRELKREAKKERQARLAIQTLINQRDYTGNTPLLYATSYGDSETIEMLIDTFPTDIDINIPHRKTNQTPLITACRLNHVKCVKALVKGTDENVKNKLNINAKDSTSFVFSRFLSLLLLFFIFFLFFFVFCF